MLIICHVSVYLITMEAEYLQHLWNISDRACEREKKNSLMLVDSGFGWLVLVLTLMPALLYNVK